MSVRQEREAVDTQQPVESSLFALPMFSIATSICPKAVHVPRVASFSKVARFPWNATPDAKKRRRRMERGRLGGKLHYRVIACWMFMRGITSAWNPLLRDVITRFTSILLSASRDGTVASHYRTIPPPLRKLVIISQDNGTPAAWINLTASPF